MKAKVLSHLKHDGQSYEKGSTFDGDKALVEQLIADGALQDPAKAETPVADGGNVEAERVVREATAKADQLVKDAQKKADDLVTAAEADAKKVREQAGADAKKTRETAEADAKKLVATQGNGSNK